MVENLSFIAVFFVGFLSFLAPCILPFIPSYLGWLSGLSLTNNYKNLEKSKLRLKLFLNSFFFMIGFSLIFISIGATASFLGKFLVSLKLPLQQIGGGIIIIFGLHSAGLLKIPFFLKEKRLKLPEFLNKAGYLRSFSVGVIFAFGWTACVGPILASILVLAGTSATLLKGMAFLAVYSLGLSIPFLLTSLFLTEAMNYIKRFSGFLRFVPIISGGFLIILGILFLTNEFSKIVIWLYNLYNNLGIPLF